MNYLIDYIKRKPNDEFILDELIDTALSAHGGLEKFVCSVVLCDVL